MYYITAWREKSWRHEQENGYLFDFFNNGDPVASFDPTFECHKNKLIERNPNSVGRDVVLDVVRNAPAEGLVGESKNSPLDSEAVQG